MKISVDITPTEVKIAVAEYVENHKKFNSAKCDPKDVKLVVAMVRNGAGRASYRFTGAIAKVGD